MIKCGNSGLSGLSGLVDTGALEYWQKVQSYGPLVYFPQWEGAGVVSDEIINGWNGAYTGVTLGQPGIGDGNTSPWFDGVNDFNNIWTAAFQAAFNGSEGTMMIWAKVNAAGVWTDGATRIAMSLFVNASNYIQVRKLAANNQLHWYYEAGAVVTQIILGGVVDTGWICLVLTWSASAPPTGEMRAYYNGAQTGATQVGLGIWAGNLSNTQTLIGANITTPLQVWHGWLAHGVVWTRALTPAEIADLATI